jgi:dihydrofolate reductase
VLENRTGNKAMDDFAVAIDNTPKIVFSRTLKNVDWKSARVAGQDLEKEVLELKHQ